MTKTYATPVQLRTPFRRSRLLDMNLQLEAEIAALVEDNKQLRAALSLYSEVARRVPASLFAHSSQAA